MTTARHLHTQACTLVFSLLTNSCVPLHLQPLITNPITDSYSGIGGEALRKSW